MEVLPSMELMGFAGVNLTVPHKEVAFRGLEKLDEMLARKALTRERGPAPVRMVSASSDLAPYLPRADVWFSGCAYPTRLERRNTRPSPERWRTTFNDPPVISNSKSV